jgi:two-component system chemotaxis response regulator CheB
VAQRERQLRGGGVTRTRVLVVDDSALMRRLVTQVLSQDPAIEVVGAAPDPIEAAALLERLAPDVLTLDVEMPRMDGLTFLGQVMGQRPMPVVMVSSLTAAGGATTLRALELGALDFVTKPRATVPGDAQWFAADLAAKVKMAARARVRARPASSASASAAAVRPVSAVPAPRGTSTLLALGASTGGPDALLQLLQALPAHAPGVVIVQHMPEHFTKSFAERLDSVCRIRVKEAEDGDAVLAGRALLAPGGRHMELARTGAGSIVRVYDGERVNRHRPSVDVLFDSCARVAGSDCAAALLTGMGDDGARGLLALRRAGARTIAQDEASCVVYGMPREAAEIGAAELVLPLGEVAPKLLEFAGG